MAKIGKFEELIAWQKARALTSKIYRVSRQGEFKRDFGLRDQIRKASVSVMSNIAEGFERGSPREFRQFLNIAKASCAEVRSQLYVALDVEYLEQQEFELLHKQAEEVARVVGGLIKSVQTRAQSY